MDELTAEQQAIQTLAALAMTVAFESGEAHIRAIAKAVHNQARLEYMAAKQKQLGHLELTEELFFPQELTTTIRTAVAQMVKEITEKALEKARLYGRKDNGSN